MKEFREKSRIIRGEYTNEEIIDIIEEQYRYSTESEKKQIVDMALGDVDILCSGCGKKIKYKNCTLLYVSDKRGLNKIHLCDNCKKQRKRKEIIQIIVCYIVAILILIGLLSIWFF